MTVDFSELLSGERRQYCFNHRIDVTGLVEDFGSGTAELTAKCTDRVGYIDLELTIDLQAEAVCASCAEAFVFRMAEDFLCRLVPDGTKNEEDEYYVLKNACLDIDELGRELLLLNLPSVIRCSAECKGICPKCGINKNRQQCSCSLREPDPRLAKLAGLAKQLKENNN